MNAPPRLRSIGWRALPFIVLGAILVPIAVTAGWMRFDLLDADAYVSAIEPVAREEAVQRNLTALILRETDEAITALIRVQPEVGELVDLAGGQQEVLAQIEPLLVAFLPSDEFASIWSGINRLAHETVILVLRGDGRVAGEDRDYFVLDLARLVEALPIDPESEIGQILAQIPEDELPDVELFAAPEIPVAESYLRHATTVALVLGLAAALLLAAGIWLARDRHRATILAGALIALFSFGVALIFQTLLADQLNQVRVEQERALAAAYVEALVWPFVSSLLAAGFIGVLAVVGAWLIGRRAQTASS